MDKIKNPLTGRLIYKNGKTHQKLIKDNILDKDGDLSIDQIIAQNKCWECKCELSLIENDDKDDEWKCEKCGEIYFSCPKCEKENNGKPVSGDCDTLWKGGFCEGCGRHFCDHHWQCRFDGKDIDSENSELDYDPYLYCSECLVKKETGLSEESNDEFFWKEMQEGLCWPCRCETLPTGSIDEYECPECEETYYNCVLCQKDNKGHHNTQDISDNDKGQTCQKCHHHFCIAHWQNMKSENTYPDWYCDDCFSEEDELSEE